MFLNCCEVDGKIKVVDTSDGKISLLTKEEYNLCQSYGMDFKCGEDSLSAISRLEDERRIRHIWNTLCHTSNISEISAYFDEYACFQLLPIQNEIKSVIKVFGYGDTNDFCTVVFRMNDDRLAILSVYGGYEIGIKIVDSNFEFRQYPSVSGRFIVSTLLKNCKDKDAIERIGSNGIYLVLYSKDDKSMFLINQFFTEDDSKCVTVKL